MRALLLVAIGFLLSGTCRADSFPEVKLKDFAQRYADAVRTRDFAKIETFFLPALLKSEAPSDRAAVERWKASFEAGVLSVSDPTWIHVEAFAANSEVMAWGIWKARPQYQIEIQSHHSANGGDEGGPELSEAVCEQAGQFFIVRPLPK